MTPTDLSHRILDLLTHSPLSLHEITATLRGLADIEEVDHALARLEQSGRVVYLSAVGRQR